MAITNLNDFRDNLPERLFGPNLRFVRNEELFLLIDELIPLFSPSPQVQHTFSATSASVIPSEFSYYGGNNNRRYSASLDLSKSSEYRFSCYVSNSSLSTLKLSLAYRTDLDFGDPLPIDPSIEGGWTKFSKDISLNVPLNSFTGVSSWCPLPKEAQKEKVIVALMVEGGDGTFNSSALIYTPTVYFR